MRPLRVIRYKQEIAHCALAASGSIANYYNKEISYDNAKDEVKYIVKRATDGLYSGEIGLLLNRLGFRSVKLVTSDLDIVDFAWANYSVKQQIEAMDAILRSKQPDENQRHNLRALRNFLCAPNRNNRLIIDCGFGDHIRQALDEKKPIIISYNWTMFHRMPKETDNKVPDYIKGTYTYHAVCCRGYDSKCVHIVDSHQEYYKRKLKRFRDGYYTMSWEILLTTMGTGDVIVPDDYDERLVEK